MAEVLLLKKQRKSNFSQDEVEILVRTVGQYYETLYGEFSKKAINKIARHRAWLEVTKEVNLVSTEKRTLQEVKNKWKKCQHLYRPDGFMSVNYYTDEVLDVTNVWEPLTELEDEDSMPLVQRLKVPAPVSPSPESPEQVLQSQPLSPTKLKVTRQVKPSAPSPSPVPPPPPPPIEEVCLKWNSHHSNMQHTFPNLLLREQYVDATLVADGQTLKCHRVILSSCSPYFEDVLASISPYQHPVLFMKDVPFWILKCLCDFMYSGEVHILQTKLEELLAVAETLKIKGLAGQADTKTIVDTKPDLIIPIKEEKKDEKEIKKKEEKEVKKKEEKEVKKKEEKEIKKKEEKEVKKKEEKEVKKKEEKEVKKKEEKEIKKKEEKELKKKDEKEIKKKDEIKIPEIKQPKRKEEKEIKKKEEKETKKKEEIKEVKEKKRVQVSPSPEMPVLKSAKVAKIVLQNQMPLLKSFGVKTNKPKTSGISRKTERRLEREKLPVTEKVQKIPITKESPSSSRFSNPFDLLKPVYEEVAKDPKPSKVVVPKETKTVTVRHKKLKKRKISDSREESPPPAVSRKGTRSRPSRKIPKYFHPTVIPNYDQSTIVREPHTDQAVREPHADQADPFIQVQEIKSEPLYDDSIEIEDNLVGFSESSMSVEEQLIGSYDSTFDNFGRRTTRSSKPKMQPIIMDVQSIANKKEEHTLKIVNVAELKARSDPLEDPLGLNQSSSDSTAQVENADNSLGFRITDVMTEKEDSRSSEVCREMGFQITSIVSEQDEPKTLEVTTKIEAPDEEEDSVFNEFDDSTSQSEDQKPIILPLIQEENSATRNKHLRINPIRMETNRESNVTATTSFQVEVVKNPNGIGECSQPPDENEYDKTTPQKSQKVTKESFVKIKKECKEPELDEFEETTSQDQSGELVGEQLVKNVEYTVSPVTENVSRTDVETDLLNVHEAGAVAISPTISFKIKTELLTENENEPDISQEEEDGILNAFEEPVCHGENPDETEDLLLEKEFDGDRKTGQTDVSSESEHAELDQPNKVDDSECLVSTTSQELTENTTNKLSVEQCTEENLEQAPNQNLIETSSLDNLNDEINVGIDANNKDITMDRDPEVSAAPHQKVTEEEMLSSSLENDSNRPEDNNRNINAIDGGDNILNISSPAVTALNENQLTDQHFDEEQIDKNQPESTFHTVDNENYDGDDYAVPINDGQPVHGNYAESSSKISQSPLGDDDHEMNEDFYEDESNSFIPQPKIASFDEDHPMDEDFNGESIKPVQAEIAPVNVDNTEPEVVSQLIDTNFNEARGSPSVPQPEVAPFNGNYSVNVSVPPDHVDTHYNRESSPNMVPSLIANSHSVDQNSDTYFTHSNVLQPGENVQLVEEGSSSNLQQSELALSEENQPMDVSYEEENSSNIQPSPPPHDGDHPMDNYGQENISNRPPPEIPLFNENRPIVESDDEEKPVPQVRLTSYDENPPIDNSYDQEKSSNKSHPEIVTFKKLQPLDDSYDKESCSTLPQPDGLAPYDENQTMVSNCDQGSSLNIQQPAMANFEDSQPMDDSHYVEENSNVPLLGLSPYDDNQQTVDSDDQQNSPNRPQSRLRLYDEYQPGVSSCDQGRSLNIQEPEIDNFEDDNHHIEGNSNTQQLGLSPDDENQPIIDSGDQLNSPNRPQSRLARYDEKRPDTDNFEENQPVDNNYVEDSSNVRQLDENQPTVDGGDQQNSPNRPQSEITTFGQHQPMDDSYDEQHISNIPQSELTTCDEIKQMDDNYDQGNSSNTQQPEITPADGNYYKQGNISPVSQSDKHYNEHPTGNSQQEIITSQFNEPSESSPNVPQPEQTTFDDRYYNACTQPDESFEENPMPIDDKREETSSLVTQVNPFIENLTSTDNDQEGEGLNIPQPGTASFGGHYYEEGGSPADPQPDKPFDENSTPIEIDHQQSNSNILQAEVTNFNESPQLINEQYDAEESSSNAPQTVDENTPLNTLQPGTSTAGEHYYEGGSPAEHQPDKPFDEDPTPIEVDQEENNTNMLQPEVTNFSASPPLINEQYDADDSSSNAPQTFDVNTPLVGDNYDEISNSDASQSELTPYDENPPRHYGVEVSPNLSQNDDTPFGTVKSYCGESSSNTQPEVASSQESQQNVNEPSTEKRIPNVNLQTEEASRSNEPGFHIAQVISEQIAEIEGTRVNEQFVSDTDDTDEQCEKTFNNSNELESIVNDLSRIVGDSCGESSMPVTDDTNSIAESLENLLQK